MVQLREVRSRERDVLVPGEVSSLKWFIKVRAWKIRVNCISAGPMNTLAARGISGFSAMLKHYEAHAPLKRNVLPEELGATGLFLASEGSAAITGQVLYVDSGYQIMGMY